MRTTPFFTRTGPLNETMLWRHWAGYAVADRYQMSTKREYYALRNAAGLFDTSPLHKYAISGPDTERFLAGVLARDVRRCRVDGAQYTMWLDDRGFVVEDGVVVRVAPDRYLLTSAEPNLAWFAGLAGGFAVEVEDVSDDYGILAIQGPRAGDVTFAVVPEAAALRYFGAVHAKVGSAPVIVTRTGYTGDLGYEVWVGRDHAPAVFDAVTEAGAKAGLLPYGSVVLHMARIEAGLLLVDVDYQSSRYAWTDAQRATPHELGYGWMLRDREGQDRAYVGRDALAAAEPRWRRVGLVVDWEHFDRLHGDQGLLATLDHEPVDEAMTVYAGGAPVGFATSFMYSPLLKRHLAIARVPPPLARSGTEVGLEIVIDHRTHVVRAAVHSLPFYDPDRRTRYDPPHRTRSDPARPGPRPERGS